MAAASVDAWQKETFDDADDALAAELGRALLEHGAKLVFSGDINGCVSDWSQQDGQPIPAALWDMCEAESVGQAHELFRDAGANVALTNTADCGPRALQKLDVRVPTERVCAAAVRSAFSCAPAYVVGSVGVCEGDDASDMEDEASELAYALLKAGVHGLFLSGARTVEGVRALVQGAQKAEACRSVPRPIVLAVPTNLVSTHAKELNELAGSAKAAVPELVGCGVSGIACDSVSAYLQGLRDIKGLGYAVFAGLTARPYREIELAQAVGTLVSEGVSLLRTEKGIPPVGTTVLAEALDL